MYIFISQALHKDNNNDLKLSPPSPETISSNKDILGK